jgi:hypothetical protein
MVNDSFEVGLYKKYARLPKFIYRLQRHVKYYTVDTSHFKRTIKFKQYFCVCANGLRMLEWLIL